MQSDLYCVYPTGFAWPAHDERRGRYITCPNIAAEPMGLAVVDDFGFLVAVPGIETMDLVRPLTGAGA